MADMLEPFQRPIRRPRGYLLTSLAILLAAWGGYVGWQHRATSQNCRGASVCPSAGDPGVGRHCAAVGYADLFLGGNGQMQA
jgi:hypothetical protein